MDLAALVQTLEVYTAKAATTTGNEQSNYRLMAKAAEQELKDFLKNR
jgi:hypothetical protein